MNHSNTNEIPYYDDGDTQPRHNTPPLQPVRFNILDTDDPELSDREPMTAKPIHVPPHLDPGLPVLFSNSHLQQPDDLLDSDRSRSSSGPSDAGLDGAERRASAMSGQAPDGEPGSASVEKHNTSQMPSKNEGYHTDLSVPIDTPTSVGDSVSRQKRDASSQPGDASAHLTARPRVDSTQESSKHAGSLKRTPQTPQRSPLKVETASPPLTAVAALPANESIQSSPTLKKHAIPVDEGSLNTLPAVQAQSPLKNTTAIPLPSLPPLKELTGPIDQQRMGLAAAAMQHEARGPPVSVSHRHSQSYGSAASQSPMLPYYPNTGMSQASPVNVNIVAKSPIGNVSDSSQCASPPQQLPYPASAVYHTDQRRLSTATEQTPQFSPPVPSVTSIHSVSSVESHGRAASSTDGYSTSHTTPIDTTLSADGTPRPVLPPITNLPGAFKCDYPDCNNAFGTQYLLSSHKNVHSQDRPHYCPVKGCLRGEGGKGFKRKNEMIRHGLVHSSPGYICPFCPDQSHRYPRPDNLQRHVRAHHVDKDKDDPALRDVLSQRAEGTGKARRRRTQGSVSESV